MVHCWQVNIHTTSSSSTTPGKMYYYCYKVFYNLFAFHTAGVTPLSPDWTERLTPVTIEEFTSRMGPTVNIPESPLEVLKLFFFPDLLDIIVEESNRYAGQVMGEERYREWKRSPNRM